MWELNRDPFGFSQNVHRKLPPRTPIFALVFTCQSDFDAGPVPSRPRIRHHSSRKTFAQTSPLKSSPETRFSPLDRNGNHFSSKACASFVSSSRVNVYYFIAKSCAPSKSDNTSEHFRAGSSTYWRHVLNGSNLYVLASGPSVGVPVMARFLAGIPPDPRLPDSAYARCFCFEPKSLKKSEMM